MEFRLGRCLIAISPLFVCFLCIILLVDRTGIILLGLISVVIHELGHLIFMIITKKQPESVSFQLGGIIIKSNGFSGYNNDFLIAMGGCLFNLIAFSFSSYFYYKTKSEMAMLFSAANLGLFLFNLLPVSGLDGMDLIKLKLLKKFSIEKTNKICNIISISFLLTSLFVAIVLTYFKSINPTILISLIYLIILTLISIKK